VFSALFLLKRSSWISFIDFSYGVIPRKHYPPAL
jgi:hypothetical protein